MDEKAKRRPNIRFRGFDDDWQLRKLGDISERVYGNDGRMNLPTLTISAANGWMNQIDRFSGNIAGKEQKNYTLLHKGELSYNHGNSKLAKYGAVFSLENYEEALVPRVYHSFKAINSDASFIEYYFSTKIPDRELSKLISSGARMDGLLNISFSEFMSIDIKIPSLNEQIKISSHLITLDKLINLHRQELDLLKKAKRTLLAKMFPKKGEKVPELRFKGFTDDWQEQRLGDMAQTYSGGTPSVGIKKYYNGSIPFIRSSEINSEFTELYITEKGLKNSSARMVKMGDILYALYGATSGEVGRAKLVGAINQAVLAIIPKSNYDANYLKQWLRKSKNKIISTYLQGGQGNLSGTIVKDFIVDFASVEEQKKIGNFFESLDNLITLHQQELDAIKSMKKSLLKAMFI